MTEAQRKAADKWNRAHMSEYQRIQIMCPRNDTTFRERARTVAKSKGMTLSGLAYTVLKEYVDRELGD